MSCLSCLFSPVPDISVPNWEIIIKVAASFIFTNRIQLKQTELDSSYHSVFLALVHWFDELPGVVLDEYLEIFRFYALPLRLAPHLCHDDGRPISYLVLSISDVTESCTRELSVLWNGFLDQWLIPIEINCLVLVVGPPHRRPRHLLHLGPQVVHEIFFVLRLLVRAGWALFVLR